MIDAAEALLDPSKPPEGKARATNWQIRLQLPCEPCPSWAASRYATAATMAHYYGRDTIDGLLHGVRSPPPKQIGAAAAQTGKLAV